MLGDGNGKRHLEMSKGHNLCVKKRAVELVPSTEKYNYTCVNLGSRSARQPVDGHIPRPPTRQRDLPPFDVLLFEAIFDQDPHAGLVLRIDLGDDGLDLGPQLPVELQKERNGLTGVALAPEIRVNHVAELRGLSDNAHGPDHSLRGIGLEGGGGILPEEDGVIVHLGTVCLGPLDHPGLAFGHGLLGPLSTWSYIGKPVNS